jgi:glycosyltransferase involved in cell wall biosynthesis
MTSSDHDNPLVSVIVTTRNEERNIGNCLKSIHLQTYKPIEIIVVDNNSTDKTREIALGFTDVVVDKGPERSAQRNHGLCDIASGKYAMFIDADMVLTGQLISACVEKMEDSITVALHIDEKILGSNWLSKVRRFERSFYSGTVIDGVRFFRRESFCVLGGFDEDLPAGPEDWDLDKRFKKIGPIELLQSKCLNRNWTMESFINAKGVLHEEAFAGIYHNEDQQSLIHYLKKKIYYAPSVQKYVEKWGKCDPDIRQQTGIYFRYISVFTQQGQWKRLIARPILSISMIALRVIVGVLYLMRRKKI